MRNTSKGRWGGAALLGVALLAGCADDQRSPFEPGAARGDLVGVGVNQIGTAVFTVGTGGGRFELPGGHVIKFDRDAICDPITSGYGPSLWDAPCTPVRWPITITAVASVDQYGRTRVDFEPALRFVPTKDGSKVRLQLKDRQVEQDDATLMYCPTLGECYDESVSDEKVKSKRDKKAGFVHRYIRHFSGYNVSTGRASYSVEAPVVEEVMW